MAHSVLSFKFLDYRFEPAKKQIIFRYKTTFSDRPEMTFKEKITLPKAPSLKNIPEGLLDNLLSNLHLILGVSYYKIFCAPKIIINRPMTTAQADFWNKVYQRGLGEFFYRNRLDPKIFSGFPANPKIKTQSWRLTRSSRYLVGLGGGKDSAVVLELLREQKIKVRPLVVETESASRLINEVTRVAKAKPLKIRRSLDKKIFNRYPDGHNGHIPISAIYAFLGALAAVLYDYSAFVVGNEYSSNFGNTVWRGQNINHQWSKSADFENLFSRYLEDFLTPDIKYFSLLRPFYEIRIAELFSRYKKYFNVFSSCNQNFKIRKETDQPRWCGHCAKCAFSFAILAPFVAKKELLKIFKKNLFNDPDLLPIFADLLGLGKIKPLDCVGTPEETRAAFYLAKDKFKNDLAIKEFLPRLNDLTDAVQQVFKTQTAPNLPAHLKMSGLKNVLILGLGQEGQATRQYLRQRFPRLKIGIADQKISPDYLKNQTDFDLAIKTPGLPKKLVTIPYTTATNIFLSQIGNQTIGVTGSKGKSTTASLIYTILKKGGFKVRLLGNIGQPMLASLVKPLQPNEIIVLELSSYQLDDIEFSPHIAVALNLFPEHMNYHGNIKNYYSAKKNIINFQKENDIFIYNDQDSQLRLWARTSQARAVPFAKVIPLPDDELPLLGEHNKQNIRAAAAVAKIFHIPDTAIEEAIRQFKPLPHRLELVGEFLGIKFYNDAISTTPESTIMAIRSLPAIGTILLGGQDRGYDFSELKKVIKDYQIKNAVVFPDSGPKIVKDLKDLNILQTASMAEAVKFAYRHTPSNQICLLSTASPSYSLWRDFQEKGNQFKFFTKKYGRTSL